MKRDEKADESKKETSENASQKDAKQIQKEPQSVNDNLAGNVLTSDDLNAVKKSWLDRFNISRHKKIEHRTVLFCAATVLFVGCFGTAYYKGYQRDVQIANQTTPLSTQLNFSKTSNAQVKLQPLLKSQDGKTVYIPFSISTMENLSQSANNYRLYVMPVSKGEVLPKMKAQLVLFSYSGYGLIRLECNTKFEPQTMQMVIENTYHMASNSDNDGMANVSDIGNEKLQQLGQKRDIVVFSTNPGATNNVMKKRVDNEATWNQVYNICFGDAQIKQVEKSNQKLKNDIQSQLNTAKTYAQRLEVAGYDVPKAPDFVKDDWRPYNEINPDTGKFKNGTKAGAEAVSNATQNMNNPDAQYYQNLPQYLDNRKYGKNQMQDQQNQIQGQTTNESGQQNNNTGNAVQQWSQLKQAWGNILSDKQKLYIANNYRLYNLKTDQDTNLQGLSIQSPKHVEIVRQTK